MEEMKKRNRKAKSCALDPYYENWKRKGKKERKRKTILPPLFHNSLRIFIFRIPFSTIISIELKEIPLKEGTDFFLLFNLSHRNHPFPSRETGFPIPTADKCDIEPPEKGLQGQLILGWKKKVWQVRESTHLPFDPRPHQT